MTALKDILQEQLEEEYKNNEELRTENKDTSNELFEIKEKHCKLLIEVQDFKTRILKLNEVRDWLAAINEEILRTSVRNIKGKAILQDLVENSTRGNS